MKIQINRESRKIRRLEQGLDREIERIFDVMIENMEPIIEMTVQKNNGGNPLDILIGLGFEQIQEEIERFGTQAYAEGASEVIDQVGVNLSLERINKGALQYVNDRKKFTRAMEQTTRNRLVTALERNIEEGLTQADFLREARNIFSTALGKDRAEGIARMEMGNAYVTGTKNTVENIGIETGGKVTKRWNNVGDGNVRPQHRENQELGFVDIKYVYPEGAEAPPTDVGCRCTLDYDIDI
jgi:uncharacterized protein with gpF-like domain